MKNDSEFLQFNSKIDFNSVNKEIKMHFILNLFKSDMIINYEKLKSIEPQVKILQEKSIAKLKDSYIKKYKNLDSAKQEILYKKLLDKFVTKNIKEIKLNDDNKGDNIDLFLNHVNSHELKFILSDNAFEEQELEKQRLIKLQLNKCLFSHNNVSEKIFLNKLLSQIEVILDIDQAFFNKDNLSKETLHAIYDILSLNVEKASALIDNIELTYVLKEAMRREESNARIRDHFSEKKADELASSIEKDSEIYFLDNDKQKEFRDKITKFINERTGKDYKDLSEINYETITNAFLKLSESKNFMIEINDFIEKEKANFKNNFLTNYQQSDKKTKDNLYTELVISTCKKFNSQKIDFQLKN